MPPAPPFLFVNASTTQGHRVRRAGQALLSRSIFHLVRRLVGPIVGRPVHPHTLRHSFATRVRSNGRDLQIIAEALGHVNLKTAAIYAHLATPARRQRLAELLG